MDSRPFFGGDCSASQIYPFIVSSCQKADSISLAVSFLKRSGVQMLLDCLKEADRQNKSIRILCGSYMHITEPAALLMLRKELSPSVELRFFSDPHRSFHPKCWIFKSEEETSILIGSSNISRSALTSGVEWNYTFSSRMDLQSVEKISGQFERLWNDQSEILDEKRIEQYRQSWVRPSLPDQIEEDFPARPESQTPAPSDIQLEALYALQESRARGDTKALVQAATGTGKTYLAAFDSLSFKRVLFIAHREEILSQAARSFARIHPGKTIGFLNGTSHDHNTDFLFASIATLAKDQYLNPSFIKPDGYDYIVIDEFHHAAAAQYQKVLSYFRPRFLLGLSATPYRLDGKDIYALCDYNVPYQIDLFQAISQKALVPFHYYGIYDEADYEKVTFRGNHYVVDELDELYLSNTKRAESILRHYQKYPSQRAIGFCSSIRHARFMARYFCEHQIPAAAVVSGKSDEFSLERKKALADLKEGRIKILFCVDMFNEGTDIPEIDQVLFLRPTESAVIFLQQLGRGLRLAPGKKYLNVLDFIGNYKSAALGPSLILQTAPSRLTTGHAVTAASLPPDCFVDFDLKLIDLFDQLQKRTLTPAQIIEEIWKEACRQLGHIPDRCELYGQLDNDQIELIYKDSKTNLFQNYLAFLEKRQAAEPALVQLAHSPAGKFLHLLETTAMSKVYKMPLLESLIDGIRIRRTVDEKTALRTWKAFFSRGENWRDLGCASKAEFEAMSDKKMLSAIRNNPAKFLIRSGQGFFKAEEGALLALDSSLDPWLDDPLFVSQFRDIIALRTLRYLDHRLQTQLNSNQ